MLQVAERKQVRTRQGRREPIVSKPTMTGDRSNVEDGTPPVDDKVLVKQAQAGHVPAFEELVTRYHGKLYGLIYNMTSNKEDAEDMLQDVLTKAYQSLPKFKGNSSFYTWVYRIAINRTINFLKKHLI